MFSTVLRRNATGAALRRPGVVESPPLLNARFFSVTPKEDAAPKDPKEKLPPPAAAAPVDDRFIRDNLPITFADISRAHVAIRNGVVRTKCEKSVFLSEIIGANIYLKPEFRQFTGSFKERGARNAIMKLMSRDPEAAKRGVIAASAGNHALALAYHGQQLGIPVTVVMPTVAPLAKVDKCRKFGARIIIEGMHIGEAKTFAENLVQNESLTYINGYDDPEIMAGAGTIGIELIDDVPNVDVVVVPVGGAGLIGGISCSVKTLKPECQVSARILCFGFLPVRPSSQVRRDALVALTQHISSPPRSLALNQSSVLPILRP
jgi:threonine dehydratase